MNQRLDQAPHMQCAVCKLLLTPHDPGWPFPIEYIHAEVAETHEAQPEPITDEVILRCDFCCKPYHSLYTLKTGQFVEHATDTMTGYMDDGDWAACETCVDLIRAGRWEQLARRAQRSLNPSASRAGISRADQMRQVKHMHRAFRENWDGKIPEEPDEY